MKPLPVLLLASVLVLAGCGGDDGSGARPSDSSAASEADDGSVSGDYDTSVELVDSTCEGIEVADNETTVEQEGDTVTLIHAGISYVGPLREDGRFATAAAQVTVGGDTHALAIAGTFGADGFEAQVVAQVTGGQTCDYTVAWTGTRS